MSPRAPVEFERYDEALARAMRYADDRLTGRPAYLGIRTVEVEPGRMVARVELRDELLNPFGTAHGGVMAALVDHVLGSVLYPVIERGAWAATTEFKLNLLAPARAGALEADARIVSLTRRTAVVKVEV